MEIVTLREMCTVHIVTVYVQWYLKVLQFFLPGYTKAF